MIYDSQIYIILCISLIGALLALQLGIQLYN